jgi:hypothetical protein
MSTTKKEGNEDVLERWDGLNRLVKHCKDVYDLAREERDSFRIKHRGIIAEMTEAREREERWEQGAPLRLERWRQKVRRQRALVVWNQQWKGNGGDKTASQLGKQFGISSNGFMYLVRRAWREKNNALVHATKNLSQIEAMIRRYPHLLEKTLNEVCDGKYQD